MGRRRLVRGIGAGDHHRARGITDVLAGRVGDEGQPSCRQTFIHDEDLITVETRTNKGGVPRLQPTGESGDVLPRRLRRAAVEGVVPDRLTDVVRFWEGFPPRGDEEQDGRQYPLRHRTSRPRPADGHMVARGRDASSLAPAPSWRPRERGPARLPTVTKLGATVVPLAHTPRQQRAGRGLCAPAKNEGGAGGRPLLSGSWFVDP